MALQRLSLSLVRLFSTSFRPWQKKRACGSIIKTTTLTDNNNARWVFYLFPKSCWSSWYGRKIHRTFGTDTQSTHTMWTIWTMLHAQSSNTLPHAAETRSLLLPYAPNELTKAQPYDLVVVMIKLFCSTLDGTTLQSKHMMTNDFFVSHSLSTTGADSMKCLAK